MNEIISAFFLAYSSIEDIKRREISEWVWLAMVASGMVFVLMGLTSFLDFSVSVLVCFCLALALYYSRLMGGGDGKMLIGLGALMPHYNNVFMPLFPLTVFTNALLISLLVPVYMFFRNLKERNIEFTLKGMIFLFTAYKVSKLKWYDTPLEFKKDSSAAWATPQLPFLVFLFAGFIVSLLFGDRPVLSVVSWITEQLAL